MRKSALELVEVIHIRQKLADLSIRLRIMRLNALRNLSVDENVELVPAAMIGKLFWANLHQDMGEVAGVA